MIPKSLLINLTFDFGANIEILTPDFLVEFFILIQEMIKKTTNINFDTISV